MSFTSRVSIAALVVAVATAGGSFYLSSAGARTVPLSVGTLALRERNGSDSAADLSLIDQAYAKVNDVFYRPVGLQRLLSGVQNGLLADLKAHRVANPHVDTLTTTGSREGDIAMVRAQIGKVAAHYPQAPAGELTRIAIAGMLHSLDDPYSVYLSAHEIGALNEELSGGDFGGIGVYIVQDKKRETLITPIEGNPAISAGVRPGDIVTAVNGHTTKGVALDSVEKMIRGPIGTKVQLTLRGYKDHSMRTVSVTRAQVHVPSAVARLDHGVEYVRLADFGTTSYDEVRKAMLNGKEHNAKGYVLDLRANGGGLLDAAVQISSLFIPQGTIVATIDRNGAKDEKGALHVAIGVAPLVVLVDKYTASAAEITAGAIQDYRVGTVIGTKTFGKGVVQSIYNLPDRSALKITTARYVTPLGRDINKKGIQPDILSADPTTQGLPDLRKFGTKDDKPYAQARAIIDRKAT